MATDAGNGMMTKVWGPPGWFFLHVVAAGYPVNPNDFDIANELVPGTTAERYRTVFANMGHVLPCKFCRNSYNQYIKELPMTTDVLASRDALTHWLWDIHNKVNAKLGTKGKAFGAVRRKYEAYRAKCKKGSQTGCTIPLSGFKLKSAVVVYPDIFFWKLLGAVLVVLVAAVCLRA